jgi:hypothetical protein
MEKIRGDHRIWYFHQQFNTFAAIWICCVWLLSTPYASIDIFMVTSTVKFLGARAQLKVWAPYIIIPHSPFINLTLFRFYLYDWQSDVCWQSQYTKFAESIPRPLGRPRCRWEDVRETEWGGMDWIHLTQGMDLWLVLVNTVIKFCVPQNVVKFSSS